MADQENLQGIRSEQQGAEPQLPLSEIGQPAYQLIKDFKRAIMATPEFAQTLQRYYFDELLPSDDVFNKRQDHSTHEGNAFDSPIYFTKGDNRYTVEYTPTWEREKLRITKSSQIQRKWPPDESVDISVYGFPHERQNGQFKGADIYHGTMDHGKNEHHDTSNTLTAINKAKDFLTTNFGDTQPQPPTQK